MRTVDVSTYTISTSNSSNGSINYNCDSLLQQDDEDTSQHSITMDVKLSPLSFPESESTSSTPTTSSLLLSNSSSHSLDSSTRSVSSAQSTSSSRRRRVAFDHVDIIELAVELGDHPYCTHGPALQTSGIVERRVSLDLQEYETQRSPVRRSAPELYLSSQDRMKLL